MFNRFTKEARAVVEQAREEAVIHGDAAVRAEHLLLGLCSSAVPAERRLDRATILAALADDDARILALAGVDTTGLDALGEPTSARRGNPAFSASAKTALERSLEVALERSDRKITADHVLLGVARAREGRAVRVVRELGLAEHR